MKKLLILISIIGLSACGDDFLDLAPESQANAENFYRNADDLLAAVNGTYDALQSSNQYGGGFITVIETRSDNIEDNDPAAGGGRRFRIDRFQETPTNDILQDVWGSVYVGIFRANTVLNRIAPVDMDEALKNRYRAEARFVRALSYFNLVRLWGPVPLILEAESPTEVRETAVRTPVADIYAAIEADLQFGIANLPDTYAGNDRGRVTSGAARTLLGKVYLTQQRYAEAEATLRLVLGRYQLLPQVARVFAVDNALNDEMIFVVRYRKDLVGEEHGTWYGITNIPNVAPGLLAAYAPEDERVALLEFVAISPTSATKVPRKFLDEPFSNNQMGNDFPVLRYADVLLMLAEALNAQRYVADGEAFDLLNQVRTRAGVAALSAAELPDQASFRVALLNERRLELALENHRWFDLVRTGQAPEAMQAINQPIQPFQLVYPIPQREIDVFNDPASFAQNEGY